MALPEYPGIGITEQLPPEEMPYHIIAGIAQNSGSKQNQGQHIYLDRHIGLCGNGTCHKQQGVPRQKRCNHQTGFTENNQEQDDIRPGMVFLYNINHILIDMKNEIQ